MNIRDYPTLHRQQIEVKEQRFPLELSLKILYFNSYGMKTVRANHYK